MPPEPLATAGASEPPSAPREPPSTLPHEVPPAPHELPRLFESHVAFVWRNLRRLGVPTAQIEDATQDVFLVVHRRREMWSPDRCSVETWLFGIALRVARNYRRAQQRRLAWLLPWPGRKVAHEAASPADGPAELLDRADNVRLFEACVAEIDEGKRAVFLLVDVEQRPVPEAAAALGMNLNTAYWRLRQARLAFRRALIRLREREDRMDRYGR